jgi:hypothetical protein
MVGFAVYCILARVMKAPPFQRGAGISPMTDGERFVDRLPRKKRFYDRHEHRTYEMTRAVAARLIDAPDLVHNARSYMERHMKDDPSQSRQYAVWQNLLRRDVQEIVRLLLEDSSNGAFLRDTQPVFFVFPLNDRKRILSRAT